MNALAPQPQTNLEEPLVLIVTGPPASGKTTIGRPLALALGLPFLSKDLCWTYTNFGITLARIFRVFWTKPSSRVGAGSVAPVSRKIVVNHVSYPRTPFNADEYERRTREGPCFICAIADGDPDYRGATAMIHEDSDVLIFLNRYPTLRGYTLVCPGRHVESVVAGFNEPEYLELQRWIYRVGRAVEQVVVTERLYILSLGSQQGNRHVHWHIAPLPTGVPYAEQRLAALAMSRGILSIPADDMARLAREIREALFAGGMNRSSEL